MALHVMRKEHMA